ncbi:MAG: putative selenate reductase subunit YgfK [Synergistaceae bacterium]|nr:putative selenate reductase subunit YgfK [Synergistaceae bacterium]
MSDRMTPVPFGLLMNWALKDIRGGRGLFGVRFPYSGGKGTLDFLGEKLETPFGPAAGPHTQLAQNIMAAYFAGARFFELKTVQILDGEDLPVSKPCIDARDECYNVEWSTELRVRQAMEEYIKAWYALKLLSKEFALGAPDGFIFNMSVGYDFEGIKSPKIDSFIEGLKDASSTEIWRECESWALDNLSSFQKADETYIRGISPAVCGSITLSTLHGCPPQEIERIASYLLDEKKLNTFIKCNPTLLGYEYARARLDELGFSYIKFDERHFLEDLQYADALPMLERLSRKADENGLGFGVKLTNTFPVDNPNDFMAGDEMYMSGRSLFPLTLETARRLSADFGGRLRISWSGGADAENISQLYGAGIWPVTLATTLLKPGGYQRLRQLAEEYEKVGCPPFERVDEDKIKQLSGSVSADKKYRKAAKAAPIRKIDKAAPLTNCFIAPCEEGCPINQDVPEYVRLAGEGKFDEALSVILDKNPLPFITGTICNHRCMSKCTRNFYDESVEIRAVKLLSAEKGLEGAMKSLPRPASVSTARAAVIGGGPAGMAAAYFLGRNGVKATVFEKASSFGGVVNRIIPDFRITGKAVEEDLKIASAYGAEFVANSPQRSVEELKKAGFKYVIMANGAWKHGRLKLDEGETTDVFDFLEKYKNGEATGLGEYVAVIGGGNTAMDAARAAKRVKGVQKVSLVYRRTKAYMPADAEELELALSDGVIFRELLTPKSFKDGVLRCARVRLGEADASGRRIPVETDEIAELPADSVIAAVGEDVESELFTDNGIEVDAKGRAVCGEDASASLENVYVIGDARRGPASVVEAIADARTAADAIARAEGLQPYSRKSEKKTDAESPREKKGIIIRAGEAKEEAERCLECSALCENCADVCPNRANVAVKDENGSPQMIHIDAICNECGNCESFCPWEGAPYKDRFTLFTDEKDFAGSSNSGYVSLDGGVLRVRLNGSEYEGRLSELSKKLPTEITGLIKAAEEQIALAGRARI